MLNFQVLDRNAEETFLNYRDSWVFGDHAFSMFYAWQRSYSYTWTRLGRDLAVLEWDPARLPHFTLFQADPAASLREPLGLLADYARSKGAPRMYMNFVPEGRVPDYLWASEALGLPGRPFYEKKYSDYIYEQSAFISLRGDRQKGIRGNVNYLLRTVPSLHFESYRPELLADCITVFDSWCEKYDCSKCFFGCERTAFLRFMQIYDPRRCFAGLTYDGSEPLSFAVGERLPGNMYCFYFQKNARQIRGLTYYLERELAIRQPEGSCINLAEDMGLPGIRQDKQQLHPTGMLHKYTIELTLEARA